MNHASLLLRGASDDDVEDWMAQLVRAADMAGRDDFDAGPVDDDDDSPNSSMRASDERVEHTMTASAIHSTLPTMSFPSLADAERASTMRRTANLRPSTQNLVTSRVDFAALQRSLLASAGVAPAPPAAAAVVTPASVVMSVPARAVSPPLHVSAPVSSAGATSTLGSFPPRVASPGFGGGSASSLPVTMPISVATHSIGSDYASSSSSSMSQVSKSPPDDRTPLSGSLTSPFRPLSPISEELLPQATSPQPIRSTAAHKDPQPLSNQSKLEWLRQAKRELVSEADPLLQYDVDYSARLGKGGFGEVYLATHKVRGEKVAIKQLQISKKNRMEYLLIETDLHARVSQHRNVVRFVDAFLLREEKQFWVVMEFIDGAPLSEVKTLEAFSEEHACWVVRNVLDALVYIHHTNRIHRDVKSANVLLSVTGEVKLTDFGLAAQLTEEMQYRKTMLGTADFMSPELLRGEAYGCKVDVWALGMMMHEMLRGATPFSTCTDPQQVLSQIEAGGVPQLKRKKLSGLATKFVEECLRESPDARPDSATLLDHAWFKSFGQNDGACIVPLVQHVKSGGDPGRPLRPGDTPTTSGCSVQ